MIILAHRGDWTRKEEQNTSLAFERAFSRGRGVELDVRQYNEEILITHDHSSDPRFLLRDVLKSLPRECWLAVNIKEDGLAEPLHQLFRQSGHQNWFAFDMSIPDMRPYMKLKLPTFTRRSEVENGIWEAQCQGVWLDAFEGEWYPDSLLEDLRRRGLRVAVVSPELHGRPHQELWNRLKALNDRENPFMLCTDFPEQADHFFNQ